MTGVILWANYGLFNDSLKQVDSIDEKIKIRYREMSFSYDNKLAYQKWFATCPHAGHAYFSVII